MMAELPYQAEYAKSGRSTCKLCYQNIFQGDLRFAVRVNSTFYAGKQLNWHHKECFFRCERPATVTEISNFNKLTHDDQMMVKEAIESYNGIVMSEETKDEGTKTAKKRTAEKGSSTSTAALKDFRVEYSKNSRDACRSCDLKICEAEVRICKTVFDTEDGYKVDGQHLCYHVLCFNKERAKLLYFAGGDSLPGFTLLSEEDQAMVKKEIKVFKSFDTPVKKLKAEPNDESELKENIDKEKKIEEQNRLFHKHRKALDDLKTKDLKQLLRENSQAVPVGRYECLNRLADIMAFGALEPCPKCKEGQLELDTIGYRCTGYITAWTKCLYETQVPKREPMIIPDSYKKVEPFIRFRANSDVRLFMEPRPATVDMVVVKDENKKSQNQPVPPLKNLQIFIHGKLSDMEETKKRILKLGGLVVSKLTNTTVAAVSTTADLERMNEKMKEIKDKDIMVIEESFLDKVDPESGTIADSLDLIRECNIAEWGADPASKLPQPVLDLIHETGSMNVSLSTPPSKTSVKLKIKGGTAVDPESGLADEAHVFVDGRGDKLTAVLSKTDVALQQNSYYKLQVLENDVGNKYHLFRSWGTIGTTNGGTKLERESKDDAVRHFEDLYMEKTGNDWHCRDTFEKVPGLYHPIEVDYGDETECLALPDTSCKLPMPVQKLVTTIFDINAMWKTLLEFELDTETMPLGNLSKKQIRNGYTVLTEILNALKEGTASQDQILDATNRFFTMIPHSFGTQNAPLLDNAELVMKKAEMLHNLLEIEIAHSLLKTDEDDSISPIESLYKKLNTEITPLDKESEEFEMLAEYTKNTHAAFHSKYTLEIQQVFKVVRAGEEERYKPFKKLHNRRLLWHGSRVTNFAGILSQGLRIAPPEAPLRGCMFGKGIYFADMVSKSANYCCIDKSNPTGLLLLCEVALGNMKECHGPESVKLPVDKHSAWGVGRTEPDPAGNRTLDCGSVVPMGKPYDTEKQTSLRHNEFIVYDAAQVYMKYILQMKFNHRTNI